MMRITAIALATLLSPAHALGPTESAVTKHGVSFGHDDKWWKCDLYPNKGCQTGPLDKLGLTKEQRDYALGTLDQIPWHPAKASMEKVAAVIGGNPTTIISKQTFLGIGPGTSDQRGVSIYYYKGYVSMIHWFQPNQFMLVKRHADPF